MTFSILGKLIGIKFRAHFRIFTASGTICFEKIWTPAGCMLVVLFVC